MGGNFSKAASASFDTVRSEAASIGDEPGAQEGMLVGGYASPKSSAHVAEPQLAAGGEMVALSDLSAPCHPAREGCARLSQAKGSQYVTDEPEAKRTQKSAPCHPAREACKRADAAE